jgi:hypothetical protein
MSLPERTAEDERLEKMLADFEKHLDDLNTQVVSRLAALEAKNLQGRVADLENKVRCLAPLEPLAEFADDIHRQFRR